MIYAQSNIATMIAGRLAKSKGILYTVTKVTPGFQVTPVVKIEAKTPLQIPTAQPMVAEPTTFKASTNANTVTLKLKFRGESPKYVDVWLDGKPISFGKSTLISWAMVDVPGDVKNWVEITMPKAVAKKRGLLVA